MLQGGEVGELEKCVSDTLWSQEGLNRQDMLRDKQLVRYVCKKKVYK
jgi:hypothetical protein